ncbi:MAG TPA: Ni/Fe hydrogenase subunit alpha [Coriobacteriia bacterium]
MSDQTLRTTRLDHVVKRIEGHGEVSIFLRDDGTVSDAQFRVVEFRGFEKMVQGRMVWEMPQVTSRVCGICPVSHHLASVKAIDDLLGVEPPPVGKMLRELLCLAGFVHDHALHFFFLAGPDFLLGDDPPSRDLLGVLEARPDLALRAVALRKAGQAAVRIVGGQAGHPVAAIPGGMARGITSAERDEMRGLVAGVVDDGLAAERLAREATLRLLERETAPERPMASLAQMGPACAFDVYDGGIIVADAGGSTVERFEARDYRDHIAEAILPHSYAKAPYLSAKGPVDGLYRVGPLARMNLAMLMPGPVSRALLGEYRDELGSNVQRRLAYHWARMIELVAVLERMAILLDDPSIVSEDVRVPVERRAGEGAAAVEAPRGTLIHRYVADAVGRVESAELIVATTHNNAALNQAVLETVPDVVEGGRLAEDAVRRIELGIRAYDPCLSCATHEVGRLPLVVRAFAPDGALLAERGA